MEGNIIEGVNSKNCAAFCDVIEGVNSKNCAAFCDVREGVNSKNFSLAPLECSRPASFY